MASLRGDQLIGFYASTKVPMRSFCNDCTGLGRRCICRCRLLKQNRSADSFKCFGTFTSRSAVYCMIERCFVWTRSCKILDALRRTMAKANRKRGQPPLLTNAFVCHSMPSYCSDYYPLSAWALCPMNRRSMLRSTRMIAPPRNGKTCGRPLGHTRWLITLLCPYTPLRPSPPRLHLPSNPTVHGPKQLRTEFSQS